MNGTAHFEAVNEFNQGEKMTHIIRITNRIPELACLAMIVIAAGVLGALS